MKVILQTEESIRVKLSNIEGSTYDDENEFALIELQGTIISRDGEKMDGRLIGNLSFELGNPVLIIGMNRCEGFVEKLKSPIALLEKQEDDNLNNINKVEESNKIYLVSGIIKSKIVFKSRPKPLSMAPKTCWMWLFILLPLSVLVLAQQGIITPLGDEALDRIDLFDQNLLILQHQETLYNKSVAILHEDNKGLIKSQDAINMLEECAEMGGITGGKAFRKLGLIYMDGIHIKRDYWKMYEFFKKGNDLGDPASQRFIAFTKSTGLYFNVSVDAPEALVHYYFSSLGGDILATLALAFRHKVGYGVPKQCSTALSYYDLAASHALKQPGMRETLNGIDITSLDSETVLKRKGGSNPEDIVQYFQQLADSGEVNAQVAYGQLLYHGGRGVAQDYVNAAYYFRLAADAGDIAAMSNLGNMYSNGLGVPQNNETALAYFKEAAEAGQASAMTGLGVYYLYGYGGLKVNVTRAFELFEGAAEQGHTDALYKMGIMKLNGIEEIKQDTTAALLYFKRASHGGHIRSMFQVGQMNQYGIGTEANCLHAVQLYKLVAEASPQIVEVANKAHNSIVDGDEGHALLLYSMLADVGVEVASSNAAFLLDKGVSVNNSISSIAEVQALAVPFLKLSYDQGNMKACLKLGDYHFYGYGGLNISMEVSAQYYQVASDHHVAQAMWNLGYMHEYGMGIEKDLFLAKRFYDSCAATDKDGMVVASLSLFKWWANYYYSHIFSNGTSSSFSNDDSELGPGSNEEEISDFDLLVEDLLISILIILILIVVMAYS